VPRADDAPLDMPAGPARAPRPTAVASATVTVTDMLRILIVGCGGSGKTHLANRLAARLALPLTHLDALYYDSAWNPVPPARFAARQRVLTAGPHWIIEGNYASTLPIRLAAADTVIFLDLPARTCLLGVAQRRLRYRGGQHPADGVYDRITWGFIRYILGYRAQMRPRVRTGLREHAAAARLVTLTSRRQVTRFLTHLDTLRAHPAITESAQAQPAPADPPPADP
jgi:adenylate kinase family enzyme